MKEDPQAHTPPETIHSANLVPATPGANPLAKPLDFWQQPRAILLFALGCGLTLGAFEALLLVGLSANHRVILDRVTPYFWTMPLSEAVMLLIPGLGLWGWARWRGVGPRFRKLSLGLVAFFFWLALIFSTLMTLMVMLHPLAMVILALGLAAQTVRLLQRHPAGAARVLRGLVLGIILLATSGALVTKAGFWLRERQLTRNTPAAEPGRPNILLVVMDTVRAKSLSLYGHSRKTTPALERWAQRGMVFEQAVAAAPYTLTSHATLFSGRYPQELPTDWFHPVPTGVPTLAEILRSNGYTTAGFVANYRNAGRQTGLDRGFNVYVARDFPVADFLGRSVVSSALTRPLPGMSAEDINTMFLAWREKQSTHPYFAFLNYMDCHVPYRADSSFDDPSQPFPREAARLVDRWSRESFNTPVPDNNPAILALARDAYEVALRGIDRSLDRLLQTLEARGDLTNTIVIITSDHGEQFGEHQLVQHADSLYRSVLHVPLLVMLPRGAVGRERQMVALRDLPATLLDLLDLPSSAIPGDSFAKLVNASNAPVATLPAPAKLAYVSQGIKFPPWHPNSAGPVTAVFLEGKHYIQSPGKEELYDFESDPEETNNLAASAPLQELLLRCRELSSNPGLLLESALKLKDREYSSSLDPARGDH